MTLAELEEIEKRGARCLFHKCVCGSDVDVLCTELRKSWEQLRIAKEALNEFAGVGYIQVDKAFAKIEELEKVQSSMMRRSGRTLKIGSELE